MTYVYLIQQGYGGIKIGVPADPNAMRYRRPIPGAREHDATQLRAGVPDQMLIFVGNRKGAAAHRRVRDGVLCPMDISPATWDWQAREKHVAILHATEPSREFVEQLIHALLEQGAAGVTLSWDGERLDHRVGHAGLAEIRT